MKRLICAFLAVAMMASLLGAALAASGTVRTTGNVWLRTGPGLGYRKITALSKGTKLTYLGKTSVDDRGVKWYRVRHDGTKGWVSSRYSKLSGASSESYVDDEPEVTHTPKPTATPEPTPTPTPIPTPEASPLPDLSASSEEDIFANVPASLPTAMPAETVPEAVELSSWYLKNLEEAAAALELGTYQVDNTSETPVMYSNEVLLISGRDVVEHFRVTGEGYAIFGVTVGMDMESAAAAMTAAGLARTDNILGASFRHYAAPDAPVNVMGFDSFINIVADADGKVSELSWSVYTV